LTFRERASERDFGHRVYRLQPIGGASVAPDGGSLVSPKTVSVYRARILEKLGLTSNAEVAAYTPRQGLMN
jgi:hypothetical protein